MCHPHAHPPPRLARCLRTAPCTLCPLPLPRRPCYSGPCSGNCSTPRDDSSDQLAPDAYTLERDLSITALNDSTVLDFNFITSATVVGVNRTLRFSNMTVENARWVAGRGRDGEQRKA